jgi:hypothetical protein
MEIGQLSAANTAIKGKGILSGKWIERAEVGAPGEYETMIDDELERRIMERVARLGFAETQHWVCYPHPAMQELDKLHLVKIDGQMLTPLPIVTVKVEANGSIATAISALRLFTPQSQTWSRAAETMLGAY